MDALPPEDASPDLPLEGPPPLLLEAPHRQKMMEWLAVLGAADIPARVIPRPEGGWQLEIDAPWAEKAKREIDTFEQESRHWPPPWSQPGTDTDEVSMVSVLIGAGLVIWFGLTGPWDARTIFFEVGAADAQKVLAGEWWRLLTSLTLHADVGHVTSNAFCCALIGTMVCRRAGEGAAWLLIVISGALGTLVTDFLYQSGHVAVGASTAIFGAIGILAGMRVVEYLLRRGPIRFRGIGVPLVVVLAVFSLMGISPEADIMAHLMGAIMGFFVGLPAPWLARVRTRARWQLLFLAMAFLPVLLAWMVALQ